MYGKMLPLILEDAAEQVERPVTSLDVEDERLELHCRVVREGGVADAIVRARECQAGVVKLEKWLMEHEDVFSRDAKDLGCMSLVQPYNMTDSQPRKQPHSSVPLAKRKEMKLPLDLTTERTPEEELPLMAHEVVVTLQQRMEATR
ncbi:hypothetical protein E2C01_058166 [Portunus trituberculatus]|uniref:Uncharacterized protein n=1 Tax=Portunus trituberculatus TaxID=210409 RepID=A0A5B7H2G6_PORTR|nr:hypothetical protein [Portunus trituberculatus]